VWLSDGRLSLGAEVEIDSKVATRLAIEVALGLIMTTGFEAAVKNPVGGFGAEVWRGGGVLLKFADLRPGLELDRTLTSVVPK